MRRLDHAPRPVSSTKDATPTRARARAPPSLPLRTDSRNADRTRAGDSGGRLTKPRAPRSPTQVTSRAQPSAALARSQNGKKRNLSARSRQSDAKTRTYNLRVRLSVTTTTHARASRGGDRCGGADSRELAEGTGCRTRRQACEGGPREVRNPLVRASPNTNTPAPLSACDQEYERKSTHAPKAAPCTPDWRRRREHWPW